MQGTLIIKGPGMPGTLVTFGTRYVWNFGKNRDWVCLEHQSNWVPDMPGTFEKF